MRAKIAKIAAAALLAVGSAAVIVATASASEDTDIPVPASSASGQPEEPAPSLTESPRSTLAPEPGSTTASPPEPGSTTTPPPDQSRTTGPPPEPGRTTSPPPEQGESPDQPPHGYNGAASYFSPDGVPGACGQVIRDSDFVVALDHRMFGSGSAQSSQCGRKVVVTHNGRSITATVLDANPTSDMYGLDLTRAAYQELASLDEETIDITWRFVE
ncbi:hypothetical protein [Streptomyces sp. NPDC059802]|uniref:hypothetical protein n=1 Tax=Streptomyces sp. NPDC059802 TaxID=3346952 RepID=UPI0036540FC0